MGYDCGRFIPVFIINIKIRCILVCILNSSSLKRETSFSGDVHTRCIHTMFTLGAFKPTSSLVDLRLAVLSGRAHFA